MPYVDTIRQNSGIKLQWGEIYMGYNPYVSKCLDSTTFSQLISKIKSCTFHKIYLLMHHYIINPQMKHITSSADSNITSQMSMHTFQTIIST
jgi:hypothetical protein